MDEQSNVINHELFSVDDDENCFCVKTGSYPASARGYHSKDSLAGTFSGTFWHPQINFAAIESMPQMIFFQSHGTSENY